MTVAINGYRFCSHCVRKIGGSEQAWTHPGIFNWHTGVRHLNPDELDLSTLCGLDTNRESWETPWREIQRRNALASGLGER